MGSMEKSSSMPPEHFKKLDNFQALVDEAYQDDTELWLVQIPNTELGPNDLLDKQWRMHTAPRDGKLGRFYNSRGQSIDIIQQDDLEGAQTHAFIPITSTESFAVRRVTHRVSFVRQSGCEAGEAEADRLDKPTTTKIATASLDYETPPPKRLKEETGRHTFAGKENSDSFKERKKSSRRVSK